MNFDAVRGGSKMNFILLTAQASVQGFPIVLLTALQRFGDTLQGVSIVLVTVENCFGDTLVVN